MNKIVKTEHYRQGFYDGSRGRRFDPPISQFAKTLYMAGFNISRGSDLTLQMTDTQKDMIFKLMGVDYAAQA